MGELDKAPSRYRTAQVKPYFEDSEEVSVNYTSSFNKAIANYRSVDDGGVHYCFTTYSFESTSVTSKSSECHSQILQKVAAERQQRYWTWSKITWKHPNAFNWSKPKLGTHARNICEWKRRLPLWQVVLVGGTLKVVMRAEIPPSANVRTAWFVLVIKHIITGEGVLQGEIFYPRSPW